MESSHLAEDGGLKGAIVSIDAIACNGAIARDIREAGADYLLAVKGHQPSLRGEVEAVFEDAPEPMLDRFRELDKGHGRIEQRDVIVAREVDWLSGDRRFPGELRLPHVAAVVRVESKVWMRAGCRCNTRYYITSASAPAEALARAIRAHWGIENQLHWVLDVTFDEDRSRVRKGHGARNMAVVRHFALNMLRSAAEDLKPQRAGLRRNTNKLAATRKTPISRRRKIAAWNIDYLAAILKAPLR